MKTNHGNLPEGAKARLGKRTINSIQFSPKGERLAIASGIGVWIYDTHTGKELFLLGGHTRNVTSVVFSPSGRKFASGGEDGTIRLWDTTTGTHLKTHTMNNVKHVIFSPDRHTVATMSWGNSLQVRDIATGNLRQTLVADVRSIFLDAVFSPSGRILAISEGGADTFDGDCPINLWDATTKKHLKTLTVVWGGAFSMAFSPDGRTLVNDSGIFEDHSIYLWDIATGKHLKTFTGHEDSVHSLTFSPDGRTLAGGCSDSTIYLWNIDTGKRVKRLTGHTASISNLCFSPDGNTLASGCKDGIILLWDVDTASDETILTEEDSEFRSRASQIRQICTERSITTLVHFTRIENLQSILHEGLIGRSVLESTGQQFLFNDYDRVDGHKEAICLSISFPNYQMFYSIREKKRASEAVNNSQWVILLLNAKLLWELDCAFCQENAASNAVRYIPLEERKKPDALKGMFVDVCRDTKGNVYQRQSSQIPDDYPTHPQAEILVFDQIPSNYINEVHFYNETALEQGSYSNPRNYPPRLTINQQYFQHRRDQVVRQDDNLDEDDILF